MTNNCEFHVLLLIFWNMKFVQDMAESKLDGPIKLCRQQLAIMCLV